MTADSRRAGTLRARCLDFIVRNKGRVYASEGYRSLPPVYLAELGAAVEASGAAGMDSRVSEACTKKTKAELSFFASEVLRQ